ncbi:MAG: hypothetical protein H5T69_02530 [Chloroflexi bacterium]|nr:hypothetical protein [Chloroflexota bacterium]
MARRCTANRGVRVAIIGPGVVGTTYAVYLARAGMDVTLLARGEGAQTLGRGRVAIRDLITRRRLSAPVHVVSALPPDDRFDLALLTVRAPQTIQALAQVRDLDKATPLVIMQNNSGEVAPLLRTCGESSLLLGFPGTGGSRLGGVVHSLPLWAGVTVLGESDGSSTPRLRQAAAVLRRAGLQVEIQRHMVPWLKTQAAMLVVLAGVVRRNGGMRALSRNAAEVEFYLSTLREAWALLEASGTPVTPPAQLGLFARPRWLQHLSVRVAGLLYWVSPVIDTYIDAANDELTSAYEHLRTLAAEAGVDVPLLEHLAPYFTER